MRQLYGVLAAVVLAVTAALAADIIIPDICAALTPDSIFWRLLGCDKDAAGGGGGGAG